MFRVVQLHILILVSSLALMSAQQQPQRVPIHTPWLYSMPWRPLILPTASPLPPLAGIAQLSPGYTGPQTFPLVPQDQQQQQQQNQLNTIPQQQQYQPPNQQPYQPVLVGLFTPQLQTHPLAAPPQAGHFGLPFRPSPFAGYTDDENGDSVQGQENRVPEQQPQQQLEEPPFHARSYSKPVQEQPAGAGGFGGGGSLGYLYFSPSNAYNLVRGQAR
ncbi:uncharacterized protein LOC108024086 [Drosophila biarmipes]|uniref:uncharacterized protein LOC108024086 n=1 Tax=Drosophila biarmipes TaxID=125945 RepID=UPI0007E5F4DD|nr:uncharacterized protein LOC108024086 [Drosophila biarmipes]